MPRQPILGVLTKFVLCVRVRVSAEASVVAQGDASLHKLNTEYCRDYVRSEEPAVTDVPCRDLVRLDFGRRLLEPCLRGLQGSEVRQKCREAWQGLCAGRSAQFLVTLLIVRVFLWLWCWNK